MNETRPEPEPACKKSPSETSESRPLPSRGNGEKRKRRMKLISRRSLPNLLEEAIATVLSPGRAAQTKDLETLRRPLLSAILSRLEREGQAIKGMGRSEFLAELEESGHETVQEWKRAQNDLEEIQSTLQEFRSTQRKERSRMARLNQEQSRTQDRELRDRLRSLFQTAGSEMKAEELQERVISVAMESARAERSELLEKREEEYRRQVETFERRIQKLTRTLATLQQDLLELEAEKSSGRSTARRRSEDSDSMRMKLQILARLFQCNAELQKGLTTP